MNAAQRWLDTHFGYRFSDPTLLQQALTHRSADGQHNERFEFLGDSVLNFIASNIVFETHADAREGDLSRLRSFLVRDRTLAEIGKQTGLGDHLVLGSGELKSGGFRRASILADAMEALFGAIYLDGGLDAADKAVRSVLQAKVSNLPSADSLKDPKTQLQEQLQAAGHGLPAYVTEGIEGQAHRQTFNVSCTVDALERTTRGSGRSRRAAEQAAAKSMLEILQDGSRK